MIRFTRRSLAALPGRVNIMMNRGRVVRTGKLENFGSEVLHDSCDVDSSFRTDTNVVRVLASEEPEHHQISEILSAIVQVCAICATGPLGRPRKRLTCGYGQPETIQVVRIQPLYTVIRKVRRSVRTHLKTRFGTSRRQNLCLTRRLSFPTFSTGSLG